MANIIHILKRHFGSPYEVDYIEGLCINAEV